MKYYLIKLIVLIIHTAYKKQIEPPREDLIFADLPKSFTASEWERRGVCLICVEREREGVLGVNSLIHCSTPLYCTDISAPVETSILISANLRDAFAGKVLSLHTSGKVFTC